MITSEFLDTQLDSKTQFNLYNVLNKYNVESSTLSCDFNTMSISMLTYQ